MIQPEVSSYSIRFDGAVIERNIYATLDQLARALERPDVRTVVREETLARTRSGVAAVAERLGRPFSLVVAGDFKRGKSTLVNALLGEALVTMDVAPETVAITEVTRGSVRAASIRLVDGAHVDIRLDDLPSKRLTRILADVPGPVDVVRVTAPLPSLDHVTIVDTPGTGDVLQRFDKRVQAYLPRADAVLFVVSALSPLSETERAFLTLALRPLDLAKITFVVNSLDTLGSAADRDRVVDHVAKALRASFPESAVLGISARGELDRPHAPDRDADLEARFDALRAHLDEKVVAHRDVVRGERAAQDALQVVRRLHVEFTQTRALFESGREAVTRALERAETTAKAVASRLDLELAELREHVDALGALAAQWMGGLVDRLEHELIRTVDRFPRDQVQKQLPFFVAGVLRDGLTACIEAHQIEISERAEAGATAAGQAARSLLESADAGAMTQGLSDSATFHPPTWGVLDTVNAVAALVSPLTGLLLPLIAGLGTKSGVEKSRGTDYAAALQAAFPRLRADVVQSTKDAYAQLRDHVSTVVADAQQAERENVRLALSHAIALHREGAVPAATTRAGLDAAIAATDEALGALTSFRQKLRSASSG